MMKAQGEKIRSWDEVNGQDEKTAPPDQSPPEAMEGPMRAYGQENYLKVAEEQMEDDYNSIDGILNNGDRRETDPSREDTRAKPEDQKAEAERESVMEKIREHEERIRSSVPDQVRFRKDALCPDQELC
ncbi:DUF4316 domain-containing protein [Acidaminococcus provencensis]|uniref:DUF4316 domain-containing protein n=1 Tax=Acidaminococcus provencensis TaxID=2058289 RepID=UPI0022E2F287|nr:DUF4316 domain-containing protein [Acidaminococcus provencensis]